MLKQFWKMWARGCCMHLFLVTRIHACMHASINPSPVFSKHWSLTWSISNWSTLNAGSRLRQCWHGNKVILILILFFYNTAKIAVWLLLKYNNECSGFLELWFKVKFNLNCFVKCFEMFFIEITKLLLPISCFYFKLLSNISQVFKLICSTLHYTFFS
jgi:hypothetical protein